MATGFGQPQPKPKVSERSKKRTHAAKEFDKRRSSGDPEFEIYIRIQGKTQWYPVGVIAVQRSSQVNQAIFGSLDDLHEGAFRLYPILRKNHNQLEYGYRLKEFKDESIQLAVEPNLPGMSTLQAAMHRMKAGIAGLFNRSD